MHAIDRTHASEEGLVDALAVERIRRHRVDRVERFGREGTEPVDRIAGSIDDTAQQG